MSGTGNGENPADLLTPEDLRQFTGTDNWYKHWMGKILYTDGVKHFAEMAGAFWFIDVVGSPLRQNRCRLKFLEKIKFEIRNEKIYQVF